MRRRRILALPLAAIAALAIAPAGALGAAGDPVTVGPVDTIWVVIAAVLVLFMQAGFAMLEIGLSRMKNAGAVAAKIIFNLAIALIMFWALGFALGFGTRGDGTVNGFVGASGWFLDLDATYTLVSNAPIAAQFLFQVVFVAVSLAIVWGAMLDRTKFAVYAIFGIIFAGVIYPIAAHWSFGGGWLAQDGFIDFAGSSVVHLQGALAALAGTLLLGPRIGKFGKDGKAIPIPGHSIPLAILGVLILWVGWMGFNPGSFLGAFNGDSGVGFADVAVNTNLAAAAGLIGATLSAMWLFKTIDVSQMGNGAIAGLVAITAPCAFVDPWAALVIGLVAGLIVPPLVMLVDRLRIDDPIGCLPVHGVAGIWGTLAAGIFAETDRTAVLAKFAAFPYEKGLLYGGGHQLWVQVYGVAATAAFTFTASFLVFYVIKKTIGMRVSEADELRGLDISEHGMFGYPERFIEVPGAEPEDHHIAGAAVSGLVASSAGTATGSQKENTQ